MTYTEHPAIWDQKFMRRIMGSQGYTWGMLRTGRVGPSMLLSNTSSTVGGLGSADGGAAMCMDFPVATETGAGFRSLKRM